MTQHKTGREQITAVTPREAAALLIESQQGLWTVEELLRALDLAASNEGAKGEQKALDWTLILPALLNQVKAAAALLEPVEMCLLNVQSSSVEVKVQRRKALREVEKAEERITARQAAEFLTEEAARLEPVECLKSKSSSVEVNHECRCR